MTGRLEQLETAGQAAWLDFVERGFLHQGGLRKLIAEDGVTGVTSNPSIFEKAMGHGDAYDAGFHAFLGSADASINPPAKSIRLFSCDSRDRDFRDDLWVNRTLQARSSRQAVGRVQMPPNGYRAYLVECLMSSPLGFEYKLSTEVRVIPDGFR